MKMNNVRGAQEERDSNKSDLQICHAIDTNRTENRTYKLETDKRVRENESERMREINDRKWEKKRSSIYMFSRHLRDWWNFVSILFLLSFGYVPDKPDELRKQYTYRETNDIRFGVKSNTMSKGKKKSIYQLKQKRQNRSKKKIANDKQLWQRRW